MFMYPDFNFITTVDRKTVFTDNHQSDLEEFYSSTSAIIKEELQYNYSISYVQYVYTCTYTYLQESSRENEARNEKMEKFYFTFPNLKLYSELPSF